MITKTCTKCGIEKDINEFHKKSTSKDGYRTICKECRKDIDKKYYAENPEKYKQNWQKLKNDNPDKVRERSLKYYNDNIEKRREYSKLYHKNNLEKVKERIKKWEKNNPEKVKEKNKRYSEKNRVKINEKRILRRNENYIEYRKLTNEYVKEKRLNDPLYRLKGNLRSNINRYIKSKGLRKNCNTAKILGCDYETIKVYLESQFEPWMNWENYGLYNGEFNYGWDVDHIIPQSTGNTEDEIFKLNHYTNLRPLCSKINRVIKRNKVDY